MQLRLRVEAVASNQLSARANAETNPPPARKWLGRAFEISVGVKG